jgi:hypothetical protein
MTDNRQSIADLEESNVFGAPIQHENAENRQVETAAVNSDRRERRRLIRAAVASVPVVLTFTAGRARAEGGTALDSSLPSPATPQQQLDSGDQDSKAADDTTSGELTPAEKLETFGLERAERPASYSEDPFRDLDALNKAEAQPDP